MSEKEMRKIFMEEFGTEHPSELLSNMALRILNLEKVVALASEALAEVVIKKKIMTEEEFDALLEKISKKIDKQFEEYLKKAIQATGKSQQVN